MKIFIEINWPNKIYVNCVLYRYVTENLAELAKPRITLLTNCSSSFRHGVLVHSRGETVARKLDGLRAERP